MSVFDLYPHYLFLRMHHINEGKVIEGLFEALNKTLQSQNRSMSMRSFVDEEFQKIREDILNETEEKLPTK